MAIFKCQNSSCTREFKPQMGHENKTGLYLVSCPHCGAVHESVEKGYEPSGAATFRFQVRTDRST